LGTLPLDLDKLPYDEVLRRLREDDAPRPSTRLSALGDKSSIAAKNCGAGLQTASPGGVDDYKSQGHGEVGNRFALPTSPHPDGGCLNSR
jgi:hypothetical protein